MSAGIQKRDGFSLIEMALILIMIGAILGAIVPRLTSGVDQAKTQETKELLQNARDELIGYALQNNSLPAAAAGNTLPTTIATRQDAWGNNILYLPAQNATGADLTNTVICNMAETTLSVTSPGGNSTNSLAFIVASTGRNSQSDITNFTAPVWPYNAVLQSLGTLVGGAREYDDLVEYSTFDYLKGLFDCANSSQSVVPPGSEISIAQDYAGFQGPTAPVSGTSGAVAVTNDGTIQLGLSQTPSAGNTGYYCTWYQGNKAGCSSGNCDFGSGFRAYYRFVISDEGHGFTFAVINGDGNTPSNCGDDDYFLGYADGNKGTSLLDNPKMAIEYDMDPQPGSFRDNGVEHYAPVFWATDPGDDDNQHGIRWAGILQDNGGSDIDPSPLGNCDTTTCGAKTLNFALTTKYSTRIEVHRTLDAGSVYRYDINATVLDCTSGGAGCTGLDNLAEDYDYTVGGTSSNFTSYTIYMDESDPNNDFNKMYFGWTGGSTTSAGETQYVTITDFGIAFR